ncbi:MAG: hypothetical protein QOF51_2165 [Chloroflexota bacterium]|jgi:RHS repeat-associated protein|nr:hypothetical protein [Chloroflexota bacterium]
MLLDDGQRKYVYGPSGVLYEVDKSSGSPYVLHTDAQGSVRVITDSAANVVESYYNDEYGNPLITLSASAPNNVASQPRQYTAEPRDSETGFIYLRARMYDPAVGRFLQRDRAAGNRGSTLSQNRYGYVGDNPLGRSDPSGNSWEGDPGGGGGGQFQGQSPSAPAGPVAAVGAAMVSLYRAVSAAEAADIEAFNGFRSSAGSMETKLFARNLGDAIK